METILLMLKLGFSKKLIQRLLKIDPKTTTKIKNGLLIRQDVKRLINREAKDLITRLEEAHYDDIL